MDKNLILALMVIDGRTEGKIDIETLNYLHANEYIHLFNARQIEGLQKCIEAEKKTNWEREEIKRDLEKIIRNLKMINKMLDSKFFGFINEMRFGGAWRESNEFLCNGLEEQKRKLDSRLAELSVIEQDAIIAERYLRGLRPIGDGRLAKLTQLGAMLMDK